MATRHTMQFVMKQNELTVALNKFVCHHFTHVNIYIFYENEIVFFLILNMSQRNIILICLNS